MWRERRRKARDHLARNQFQVAPEAHLVLDDDQDPFQQGVSGGDFEDSADIAGGLDEVPERRGRSIGQGGIAGDHVDGIGLAEAQLMADGPRGSTDADRKAIRREAQPDSAGEG